MSRGDGESGGRHLTPSRRYPVAVRTLSDRQNRAIRSTSQTHRDIPETYPSEWQREALLTPACGRPDSRRGLAFGGVNMSVGHSSTVIRPPRVTIGVDAKQALGAVSNATNALGDCDSRMRSPTRLFSEVFSLKYRPKLLPDHHDCIDSV